MKLPVNKNSVFPLLSVHRAHRAVRRPELVPGPADDRDPDEPVPVTGARGQGRAGLPDGARDPRHAQARRPPSAPAGPGRQAAQLLGAELGPITFTTTRIPAIDDSTPPAELEAAKVEFSGRIETTFWSGPHLRLGRSRSASWPASGSSSCGAWAAGPTQALSFGRSKAKIYDRKELKTTFADVAGVDEAKAELMRDRRLPEEPEEVPAPRRPHPQGRAPGRARPAPARRCWRAPSPARPTCRSSPSPARSSSRCSSAWAPRACATSSSRRKEKAPCIVFIDELDAIGKSRAGSTGFLGGPRRARADAEPAPRRDGRLRLVARASSSWRRPTGPRCWTRRSCAPGRFDRQVLVDRPDVRGPRGHPAGARAQRDAGARRRPRTCRRAHAGLRRRRPRQHHQRGGAARGAQGQGRGGAWPTSTRPSSASSAGLEKKSRCSPRRSATSSRTTRSGHALVASSLPARRPRAQGLDHPARRGALGVTYQLPLEDRYLMTRSELEDRIAVLLGGRAAEELVYGEISTGAHNDLERATEIARLMVTQYGMSEQLGPMTFGGGSSPMLPEGAGMGGEREYSEETARVDRQRDARRSSTGPTTGCGTC